MIFLTCVVMAWVLWAFGTLVGKKMNSPIGWPSSRATRKQAIKQVEMLETSHSGLVQEEIKTDERGRIILTERMKNSLNKAQQSLEEGRCLNQDMFRKRFAKWL